MASQQPPEAQAKAQITGDPGAATVKPLKLGY